MTRKSRKEQIQHDKELQRALRNPNVRVVYNFDGTYNIEQVSPEKDSYTKEIVERDYTENYYRIYKELKSFCEDEPYFLDQCSIGDFVKFIMNNVPEEDC